MPASDVASALVAIDGLSGTMPQIRFDSHAQVAVPMLRVLAARLRAQETRSQ